MLTFHHLRLDARRRPTLPSGLIAEAGLAEGEDLVAYAEEGRIVISTRSRLLSSVPEMFRAAHGPHRTDPIHEILAERARDAMTEVRRFSW